MKESMELITHALGEAHEMYKELKVLFEEEVEQNIKKSQIINLYSDRLYRLTNYNMLLANKLMSVRKYVADKEVLEEIEKLLEENERNGIHKESEK